MCLLIKSWFHNQAVVRFLQHLRLKCEEHETNLKVADELTLPLPYQKFLRKLLCELFINFYLEKQT